MAPGGGSDAAVPPVDGTGVWERRAPRIYTNSRRPSSTGLEFRCRTAWNCGHLCGESANCFDCDFNPFVGPGSSRFTCGHPNYHSGEARSFASREFSSGRDSGDTFGGAGPSDDGGTTTWELVPPHGPAPTGTTQEDYNNFVYDGLRTLGFVPIQFSGNDLYARNSPWLPRR